MAKRGRPKRNSSVESMQDATATAVLPEKEQAWSFPSKSRCPRCGATDTIALSTQGNKQYRQCSRGVCRKHYSVTGNEI